MRSLTYAVLLFTVSVMVVVSPAQQTSTTAVPNLINYSGTLALSSGPGVSTKTVGVTFAIYRQQDGGAPIWLETQNVTPDSTGHYTVLLGSTRAEGIPTDLFSTQEQRWLGVQMQGQAEQQRVLLVSVPYAMKAAEAETIGGLPASAFMLATPSQSASSAQSSAGLNLSDLEVHADSLSGPEFSAKNKNAGYVLHNVSWEKDGLDGMEACHFDHLGSFCRRRGCKTFAVQHGYGSNTQRVVCDHCHG